MKIGPQRLLKTKWQKSDPQSLLKTNQLRDIRGKVLHVIGRKQVSSFARVLPKVEGSNVPQLGCLGRIPFRVRDGALTRKNVKNEDRTGYVYENTGGSDKMSIELPASYTKLHRFLQIRQQSRDFLHGLGDKSRHKCKTP